MPATPMIFQQGIGRGSSILPNFMKHVLAENLGLVDLFDFLLCEQTKKRFDYIRF